MPKFIVPTVASTTQDLFHVPSFATHLPLDWVFIVLFIIIVTFDALRSGAGRAATWVLTLPLAALFFVQLPKTAFVSSITDKVSTPLMQALFFVGIVVVLFILIYRMVHSLSGPSSGMVEALACGIGAAVVTVVVWIQIPALQFVWHFGTQVQAVFNPLYAALWILAAYVALAFARS